MAISPTYPGVYISETASIPHVVTPATTNLTAVLGSFPQGSTTEAVLVTSWAQFAAQFGALTTSSSLAAYAVWQFFQNEGVGAWIVRLDEGSTPASVTIATQINPPTQPPQASSPSPGSPVAITLTASSPGTWARDLVAGFAPSGPASRPDPTHVDFTVQGPDPTAPPPAAGAAPTLRVLKTVANISLLEADRTTTISPSQLASIITNASDYFTAVAAPAAAAPAAPAPPPAPAGSAAPAAPAAPAGAAPATTTGAGAASAAAPTPNTPATMSTAGTDGTLDVGSAVSTELATGSRLDQIAPAVFNIMCIPELVTLTASAQQGSIAAAHDFCEERQAFLVVDPPGPATAAASSSAASVDNVGTTKGMDELVAWGGTLLTQHNVAAATYYPWVQISDPVTQLPRFVPPSGTIAGVYAATDVARGVWKAPAGVEATMEGVLALADTTINDTVNGELNVMGINCLRTFPLYGSIVWGCRTLAGSDVGANAFKYVPVRRLSDFIEQSLQQSLRWAVFEPNGPALWSSISLEVTSFMAGLFANGAFAGSSAAQAYTVACDATTTSPANMLSGVVNVNVGFAPVDPAEFVMLNVQINAASAAS